MRGHPVMKHHLTIPTGPIEGKPRADISVLLFVTLSHLPTIHAPQSDASLPLGPISWETWGIPPQDRHLLSAEPT